MKPILFKSTETSFSSNGIGVLSDAIRGIVREERNGGYALNLEYPVDGIHFEEIVSRSIILAKPNPTDQTQPFRVCEIGKPLDGIVSIYAQHISYDLSGVAVSPFSESGIDNVISKMMANAIPADHGFTLTTDKAGSSGISIGVPVSFRSLQGGTRGSLLDVYGGEYKYDRYSIQLLNARGEDKGFEIVYGKNMTSFDQDENCSNVYTDVYPYWSGGDDKKVFLDEKTIRASGTYDFTKVLPLDLSSYFDGAPSKKELKAAAENYMTANKIGVPQISLKLSFEDFLGGQEKSVELCDTVTVIFPKMKVNAKAKVVAVEYDCLAERYVSLEIGDSQTGLADTIAGQSSEIASILGPSGVQQAIANATSWLTRTTGGNIIFRKNAETGGFSEMFIIDTDSAETATKVWRFNLGGLAFAKVDHSKGQTIFDPALYTVAITQDGQIVGAFVTAEGLKVNGANITGTLRANSVIAESIQADSITNGKIANDAVDGDCIAKDAIVNKHITSGSVHETTCNSTIQGYFADVITANKIFSGRVQAEKINVKILSVQTRIASWKSLNEANLVLST